MLASRQRDRGVDYSLVLMTWARLALYISSQAYSSFFGKWIQVVERAFDMMEIVTEFQKTTSEDPSRDKAELANDVPLAQFERRARSSCKPSQSNTQGGRVGGQTEQVEASFELSSEKPSEDSPVQPQTPV
ncbi:hypothetical protein Cni_G00677 [Canna indica]|uniref:Uncharacterized protein n=1 Tax=Canna indica TaxID=4628 RepID=A0AAQ3JL69_9LILI|nr:hypothetical protein Cni_G00677 [Canna indica]